MRCTIMSNGWINGRSHIKLNFFVSCTYVTIIFKSLDVSSWMKDAQLVFHLLDEMVMGVQVEMLCRASLIMPLVVFLLVGSWRKNTQPYSRLHPLLRISKLEWVKKLVDHAKCITKYIYNHTWLLNLMRKKHRGKGAYYAFHPHICNKLPLVATSQFPCLEFEEDVFFWWGKMIFVGHQVRWERHL